MYKRSHSGFSLVELMVAITVAMILSIGVLYVYSGQTRTFNQVARKQQTAAAAAAAFEVVTSLMRQAEICLIISSSCTTVQQIDFTYPVGPTNPNAATTLQTANDSLTISFDVPSGFNIWPNSTSPYTDNTITLSWDSADGILYAQAGAQTAVALVGASGNLNTKIINFDVWPMVVDAAGAVTEGASVTSKPTAGYRVVLTARVGTADSTYTNPLDNAGPLKNYRTLTYESTILSRNW